jgi:DNA-binding transcriptional ArsR family regulator
MRAGMAPTRKPVPKHPAIPVFKLFGVPARLIIFQRLARRPQTAGELAKQLPLSRSAVVQHLSVLKAHGLVDAAPDGKRRVYHTCPSALSPLRAWLELHEKH